VVVSALVAAAAVVSLSSVGGATGTATAGRIAGDNRYATAAAVAEATFPGGSTRVVLTSGTNYPDALTGSALAGALRAPILITDPNALSPETAAALAALHAHSIYVVGGPNAVSPTVTAALTGAGYVIAQQIAGTDRYDTAAQVAAAVDGNGGIGLVAGVKTAFVTTGTNFPDALAAGSPAWAFRLPILLTDPSTLTPATQAVLTAHHIGAVIILGGPGAVSAGVEAAINALGVSTLVRFAGANRYDTAAELANFDLAPNPSGFNFNAITPNPGASPGQVVLVTGLAFPDALAAAAYAGFNLAPIILDDPLPPESAAFLANNHYVIARVTAVGGTAAVPDTDLSSAQADVNTSSVTTTTQTTIPVATTPTTNPFNFRR